MSCSDCSCPYSLCQCPATITVGELAQLRVSLSLAEARIEKWDPRVQAALREHLEFALAGAATGGPYFVLGCLYGACHLPGEIQDKFRAAFDQYNEAERGKRRSA